MNPTPAEDVRPREAERRLADWRRVLFLFLAWRGLLFGFDALALSMTQLNAREAHNGDAWQAFPRAYFWDSWARWDAGWYHLIITEGYKFEPGKQCTAGFCPGFPYVTTAVAQVVGNHWYAGLLVSNLSLFGALYFLLQIARRELGAEAADRTLIYVLAAPTSFFLSAFYSEGLFLLASAASFHYYLERRYAPCSFWGALAAFTRPTGVALLIAYAVGLAWNLMTGRLRFRPGLFWLALIPCGFLAFMLILYVRVGDPFAYVKAHAAWGRTTASPLEALSATWATIRWDFPRDLINTITILDAASAVVFLALPLLLLRKCDLALPVYSILLILIPLATGSVKSMLRLEVVAFPAFMALARLGAHRDIDRLILFTSALFLGLFSILFANWNWVG